VEINNSVFSLCLKVSKLSADRVCTENKFQTSGAATIKDEAAKKVKHSGCRSKNIVDGRSVIAGWYSGRLQVHCRSPVRLQYTASELQ